MNNNEYFVSLHNQGRTSMHIAILKENEDMVDFIGKGFRQTLKIGDNVSEFALQIIISINTMKLIFYMTGAYVKEEIEFILIPLLSIFLTNIFHSWSVPHSITRWV